MCEIDPDATARRIARIDIARECSALERGVSEGIISASEIEARKEKLLPALNMLISLTRGNKNETTHDI